MCPQSRRFAALLACASILPVVFSACNSGSDTAASPCATVRMSDVGWTDITATTAAASVVLESIGYQVESQVVSVPVTYASLKAGDLDVFLGAWLPAQAQDLQPYLDDGSVTKLRKNLEGAKYTLAVPDYVADAGLRSFQDISKFADKLDNKIYGIEPGNDGNRLLLDMIANDTYGLGGFDLVESSEQGMLAQVARAIEREEWIVFLAWEPHPMNARFDIVYLEGGDEIFGPNYGSATVYTVTRSGYTEACPNLGQFFENVSFTLEMETALMDAIINDNEQPKAAARAWLTEHPHVLNEWLDGVTSRDGAEALPVAKAALGL